LLHQAIQDHSDKGTAALADHLAAVATLAEALDALVTGRSTPSQQPTGARDRHPVAVVKAVRVPRDPVPQVDLDTAQIASMRLMYIASTATRQLSRVMAGTDGTLCAGLLLRVYLASYRVFLRLTPSVAAQSPAFAAMVLRDVRSSFRREWRAQSRTLKKDIELKEGSGAFFGQMKDEESKQLASKPSKSTLAAFLHKAPAKLEQSVNSATATNRFTDMAAGAIAIFGTVPAGSQPRSLEDRAMSMVGANAYALSRGMSDTALVQSFGGSSVGSSRLTKMLKLTPPAVVSVETSSPDGNTAGASSGNAVFVSMLVQLLPAHSKGVRVTAESGRILVNRLPPTAAASGLRLFDRILLVDA